MKVGKAKYGGGKKTYFKLKDGDSVFRILPPLGDLADDGFWSVYYSINYGYKNAAGKSRPFVSSLVKNRDNGMIEVGDAAIQRLDTLKAKLEEAKAAKNKPAAEALLKLVGAPKSLYNLDKNHYLNAIDLQGNIGILKLRHRAKQALDTAIRKLRDKGVDPLSVENGRFFVFTRTGTGNETQFQVTTYTRTETIADVGEVERQVVHVLNEEVLTRLSSEAGELNKLFKKPTEEQIRQIVQESDIKTGISPNIDAILGYKADSPEAATAEADAESENEENTNTVENATEAAQTAPATTGVDFKARMQKSPTPETTVAMTQKMNEFVETIVETKVEPKKETATPAAAPTTTAKNIQDMSNAEFLKELGLE